MTFVNSAPPDVQQEPSDMSFISQPRHNIFRPAKDQAHLLHLVIPFRCVVLIDAESVDPNPHAR
jgi:hypothetical protein